ncbi:endopeptidase La [Ktedonospora formicarum]|uniref:Lon protease n=1 Tax=Ktedonospora formicarum TaxID=2778364 RepID=A0A8J3I0V2_9CHLR|nr:endopeptidase La [Ktedonospora formicarum]GHO44167.1 Lon protease [Ktedonospora formicarum]
MSEQERQENIEETIESYPLVALKNIVAFPHNRHALVIAREKTVRAVEEAMLRSDRMLVAATQRDAEIDDPEPKDIYTIGTLAEISTMQRQQDGSMQVLLRGVRRASVKDIQETEPFLRVLAEIHPDEQASGAQADALVRHAIGRFEQYAQLSRRFSVEDINSIVALKTANRLSDTLAAHIVTDVQQQQELLETFDPLERLEKICVLIGNEIEILELETTIRSRVRSQVDRTQKEFYLREQLRAIQEELGMDLTSESDELRKRLGEKQLPPEVATKVRKEIDRLERMPQQSAEISVIRSYIDWVLALPWNERSQDTFNIEDTRRILEEDHYGLEGIKERIIEFLAVRQLRLQRANREGQPRSESLGQILCLIGPPGVGKTSLGYSIAKALGRKFARISLGGVHDEAEIRGHRRTYVGALPGRIIQSMKTVGVRNPVFLLDEIDKLSSEYRGDPSAALLEVLDPQQNKSFVDHYLELPFDLSEVFFICTGNVKYQIPRPLADRMDIIDLPGYMLDEKVNIGLQHLWPKVLREHGLGSEQVRVPQPVMQHIVTDYTREAGVRSLERQLATICRKTARRVLEKPNTRVRLTAHNLEQYLGMPRYTDVQLSHKPRIGSAMGLGVTENGGVTLPVEVVTMVGKGDLLVTGQLGEVMRESAIAALSYIRTRANELKIDPNFQDAADLHIHMPENAMPKDGPSAGITIAMALVSALTRRPVRGDVAMTGEVTLLGNVLGIGGLKEKVLAAQQAGFTHIIAPAENKKDLTEIPAKIRQRIKFSLVESMDEVIDIALMPDEENTEVRGGNGGEIVALRRDSPLASENESEGNKLMQTDKSVAQKQEKHAQENAQEASESFIVPSEPSSSQLYPQARSRREEERQ